MKMIGLIGGMSWESTAVYYRLLNELCRERLGGLHSASLLLWSFDFAEIERVQEDSDWEGAAARLTHAAKALRSAGAECIVICTNTMHRAAEAVEQAAELPLIHIADATAAAIRASGSLRPLLLGTRYTMEQDFYRGRLRDKHGIDVMIPGTEEREMIHATIFRELCRGDIRESSRVRFLEIIERARTRGADSVILGCTEIGLLIDASHTTTTLFDSTRIHAQAALEYALDDSKR